MLKESYEKHKMRHTEMKNSIDGKVKTIDPYKYVSKKKVDC